MANKKEKIVKKNIKEEVSSTKKDIKKEKKIAILKEKMEIEKKIDALLTKKKTTKNKVDKKAIKAEIKELKQKRDKIGKKRTFFTNVRDEMRLVRWPSKVEVLKYSLACLIFVAFFAFKQTIKKCLNVFGENTASRVRDFLDF